MALWKFEMSSGPRTLLRQRCVRARRRPAVSANRTPVGTDKPRTAHAQVLIAQTTGLIVSGQAWANDSVSAAVPRDNGWLSPIVNALDFVLGNIEGLFQSVSLPYAYGWSIVSLTAFVKLLTWSLTKKQVESAMAVQQLKPRIDVIKERYGEDKDKIQKETSRLYEQAQVNPLAGCLPSLLQLPIFLGLYRSLSNVATSGTLDNEGFYWIPSLAGPMSAAARLEGDGTAWMGTSWLTPLVDGAPPIGWDAAAPYLVLPVLLVLAQYASSTIISPVDPNAENANTQRVLIYLLPLSIGWFALNVPSGLSLYYFANTFFTSAQQIYFRKLGGVEISTPDLGPVTKLGMGRRMGTVVAPYKAAAELPALEGPANLAAEFGLGTASTAPAVSGNGAQNGEATEAVDTAKKEKKGPDVGALTVGGILVDQSQMEGVSEAELDFLRNRCKRKRRAVA